MRSSGEVTKTPNTVHKVNKTHNPLKTRIVRGSHKKVDRQIPCWRPNKKRKMYSVFPCIMIRDDRVRMTLRVHMLPCNHNKPRLIKHNNNHLLMVSSFRVVLTVVFGFLLKSLTDIFNFKLKMKKCYITISDILLLFLH